MRPLRKVILATTLAAVSCQKPRLPKPQEVSPFDSLMAVNRRTLDSLVVREMGEMRERDSLARYDSGLNQQPAIDTMERIEQLGVDAMDAAYRRANPEVMRWQDTVGSAADTAQPVGPTR